MLLTPYQKDCVLSAQNRLEALQNDTLKPGDGETVTARQILINLKSAISNIEMAMVDVEESM